MGIKTRIVGYVGLEGSGILLRDIVSGVNNELAVPFPYAECRAAICDLEKEGYLLFSDLTDMYKRTDKHYDMPAVVPVPDKIVRKKSLAKGVSVVIKMRTGAIEEIHLSGETAIIDEALCVIAKYIKQDEVEEILT
jgi:hypothetical protein